MCGEYSQRSPNDPIPLFAKILMDHLYVENSSIWRSGDDGAPFEATEAYHALIGTSLYTLKNELAKLSAPVLRHHNTLQPIHRLPTEILIRIFGLLMLDPEKYYFTSEYAMHLRRCDLSLVCSDWRAIVNGTPSMWTVVSSSMPLELVERSLQRSGTAFLSVIYGGAGWGPEEESQGPEDEEDEAEDGNAVASDGDTTTSGESEAQPDDANGDFASKHLLLGQIDRWRSVTINDITPKDIKYLRLQLASHLQTLIWRDSGISYEENMSYVLDNPEEPYRWKELEVVELDNPPIDPWKPSLFSGLRSLTLTDYDPIPLRDLIEALRGSPGLRVLQLEDVDGDVIGLGDSEPELVVLAQLMTFELSSFEAPYAAALLRNVYAPCVKVYNVTVSHWPLRGEETVPGIHALLSNSANHIKLPYTLCISLQYHGPSQCVATIDIATVDEDNGGTSKGHFEVSFRNTSFTSIFSELASEFDANALREAPTKVIYDDMWLESDPHTGYCT